MPIKMTISLSSTVVVSVDSDSDVKITDNSYDADTVLSAKEARALLRALRKFEAEGLLED